MIGTEHFKDSVVMQDFIFIYSICSSKLKVSFVNKSFINIKKRCWGLFMALLQRMFFVLFLMY